MFSINSFQYVWGYSIQFSQPWDASYTGCKLNWKDCVKRSDCLKYHVELKYLNMYFSETDLISLGAMTRSKHPHQPHISMEAKFWLCCQNWYLLFPLTLVQIKIRMMHVKLSANQFRKSQVSINPEIFVKSKFWSYWIWVWAYTWEWCSLYICIN